MVFFTSEKVRHKLSARARGHAFLLVPFEISYQKADNTPFCPVFGKTDPYDPSAHQPAPPLRGPSYPDITQTRQAVLAIYNKPVRQTGGTFGSIIDFDVNMKFAAGSSMTVQWSKADGPSSGTLINPTSNSAIYRNPKQGGLYKFDLQALGQTTRAQVWCPMAGPLIDDYVLGELTYMRGFVASYNSNHPIQYVVPLYGVPARLLDYSHLASGGDWIGRFQSAHSPCGGPDIAGDLERHTICGVVVERHKLSNMLIAFLAKEMLPLAPNSFILHEFNSVGTPDSAAAVASYNAGFDLHADSTLDENALTTVMHQYGYSMQEPNSWAEHEWPSTETHTSGGITRPGAFSDFNYSQ